MLECGHTKEYICSRCGRCYPCEHELLGEMKEFPGSKHSWKCPDGFRKPSFPDYGQYGRFKN